MLFVVCCSLIVARCWLLVGLCSVMLGVRCLLCVVSCFVRVVCNLIIARRLSYYCAWCFVGVVVCSVLLFDVRCVGDRCLLVVSVSFVCDVCCSLFDFAFVACW